MRGAELVESVELIEKRRSGVSLKCIDGKKEGRGGREGELELTWSLVDEEREAAAGVEVRWTEAARKSA